MSILHRHLMSKNKPPPVRCDSSSDKRNRFKDFGPLSWRLYYDSMNDVKIDDDSFRVYLSGYVSEEDTAEDRSVTLVLLHGGGYSGLTWALFTKSIRSLVSCRVMAIDLRGHGNSHTTNDDDLSVQTLARDVGNVIASLHGADDTSRLVIIGHSMGGAVAVHCASTLNELIPNIIGLVVIDVVEGTALDALNGMQSFLRGRPTKFNSLSNAIEWCVRSGQTRNAEAARVSMPGMLKNMNTNATATDDVDTFNEQKNDNNLQQLDNAKVMPLNAISEDGECDTSVVKTDNSASEFKTPQIPDGYTWRIDLSKSEPFWKEWFTDLSSMFMNCNADAKLLLLAGIDRLDRALTIGQMQGKFQMQVLPKCGHTVHEDVPDKVAETIATFLIRNKFTHAICDFEKVFPSC